MALNGGASRRGGAAARSRSPGGFSLVEMLLALALIGLFLIFAAVLMAQLHRRLGRTAQTAAAQAALADAVRRLREDVRASAGAGVDAAGRLTLRRADGSRVVWFVAAGRLVRKEAAPGAPPSHFALAELAGFEARVEAEKESSLVEIRLVPPSAAAPPGERTGAEPLARAVYLAARTRQGTEGAP